MPLLLRLLGRIHLREMLPDNFETRKRFTHFLQISSHILIVEKIYYSKLIFRYRLRVDIQLEAGPLRAIRIFHLANMQHTADSLFDTS